MGKKYYAKINTYGSLTDLGFANTWQVWAFSSADLRAEWIEKKQKTNCTAAICRKNEIGKTLGISPRPFSGDYWGIEDFYEDAQTLGRVEICSAYSGAARVF